MPGRTGASALFFLLGAETKICARFGVVRVLLGCSGVTQVLGFGVQVSGFPGFGFRVYSLL